jgi:tetratricopeptide (TPR) repeat protein
MKFAKICPIFLLVLCRPALSEQPFSVCFLSGTIGTMQGEISKKEKIAAFSMGIIVGLVVLAVVLYQLPAVQNRVSWRIDFAMAFLRGIIDPVQPMPTPMPVSDVTGGSIPGAPGSMEPFPEAPTSTVAPTRTTVPTLEVTQGPTPTQAPTLTPTAIPGKVELPAPGYEKQEVNNCGPTTLAMHLRFYGWKGDQNTISALIKPKSEDRNVNVEELAYYAHTQVPGLEFQFRVGGDVDMLRKLIAAGFPVTIEEAFIMAESYWFNDDRWAGHYLLLTGYDDAAQQFTAQDVFIGPNIGVSYKVLDKNWKAFNRVYIVLYPPDQRETVQAILGDQWDVNANRTFAMNAAEKETQADSTDSYAWFNYGTNLVYFEKYSLAAQAYDQARKLGLPQRMLRYQFGPFFAYFHTGRIDDLLALTDYALKRTPNSEEALLWRGWAMYRKGDREGALKSFQSALNARPENPDAVYALNFIRDN